VNFVFQLKNDGQPMAGLTASFSGTRQEAYDRACRLAAGLADLLGDRKFSVRIDRSDSAATGYEIGPDGHTIACPASQRMTCCLAWRNVKRR
jgi:hypothetical protein